MQASGRRGEQAHDINTWEGHHIEAHSASLLNRRSDALVVGLRDRNSHDTPAAALQGLHRHDTLAVALRDRHRSDTVAAALWDGHRRDTLAAALQGRRCRDTLAVSEYLALRGSLAAGLDGLDRHDTRAVGLVEPARCGVCAAARVGADQHETRASASEGLDRRDKEGPALEAIRPDGYRIERLGPRP